MDVLAVIPARNEADIIGAVVRKLNQERVDVVVLDDSSTDDTAEIAQFYGASVFPMIPWRGHYQLVNQVLGNITLRKPRWGIMHAADEIMRHVSGKSLPEALAAVEDEGYNCINLWRRDYVVVKGEELFVYGDPEKHFRFYHEKHNAPNRYPRIFRVLPNTKYSTADGHQVTFDGQKMLGKNHSNKDFILKHYPLRSKEHTARKLSDRKGRLEAAVMTHYKNPKVVWQRDDPELKEDI